MTEVLNAQVFADVPVPTFQPGPAGTHSPNLTGFICEGFAQDAALNVTSRGVWRDHLANLVQSIPKVCK
ncbi:MAG: hypothetical protein H7228_16740 [Polaromonas sp.]|nr:hypothetical protein [Polaromonas sp.]